MKYTGEELADLASALPPGPRLGRPEDIAGAAHFLLSEQASYITGQVLEVQRRLPLNALFAWFVAVWRLSSESRLTFPCIPQVL